MGKFGMITIVYLELSMHKPTFTVYKSFQAH